MKLSNKIKTKIMLSSGLVITLFISAVSSGQVQDYNDVVKKFFLDTLNCEIEEIIPFNQEPLSFSLFSYSEPVKNFKVDDKYTISVGEKSKKVFMLIMPAFEETTEKKLSESEAFEYLKPFLKYYNLPLNIDEYYIKEWADVYKFRKELTYNNVLCRFSGLQAEVLKRSGRIQSIFYSPTTEPLNKLWEGINEKELKEIAGKWLKEQKYFQKYPAQILEEEKPKIVIAPKLNRLDPELFIGRLTTGQTPLERYYVYEVPFSWEERGFSFRGWVWIEGKTKEVIGGAPDYFKNNG